MGMRNLLIPVLSGMPDCVLRADVAKDNVKLHIGRKKGRDIGHGPSSCALRQTRLSDDQYGKAVRESGGILTRRKNQAG